MATTATPTPAAKTAPAKKATPAEKTYQVVSRLEHDGDEYLPGDKVKLSAKAAEPLLGHTVVRLGDGDEPVDAAEG